MNDNKIENYFFYPDNLNSKLLFFGWPIKSIIIIGLGIMLSVLLFLVARMLTPLMFTIIYAIGSFTVEDVSIFTILKSLVNYLFLVQQDYYWEDEGGAIIEKTKSQSENTNTH